MTNDLHTFNQIDDALALASGTGRAEKTGQNHLTKTSCTSEPFNRLPV